MPNIQSLRQKLDLLPDLCNEQMWPKVVDLEVNFPVDRTQLDQAIKTYGPWLAGAAAIGFLSGYMRSLAPYYEYIVLVCLAVGAWAFLQIRPHLKQWSEQSRRRREEESKLTQWIREELMKFLDPEFQFNSQPEFPKEVYTTCGLFPSSYDRAAAYGALAGMISQTQFNLVEISTHKKQTHKDSRGRTTVTWELIYRGLLFKADFNKNFNSHTLVQVERAQGRLGFLARGIQRLRGAQSELQRVKMESPEFEKVFKVTSTDPIEARYKLTPAFMEHFLGLRNKYGDGVELVFMNQQAIISIPHQKSFLPLYFNLKDLTQSLQSAAEELVDVLEIIEDLELDNRAWNRSSVQQKGA